MLIPLRSRPPTSSLPAERFSRSALFSGLFRTEVSGQTGRKPKARPGSLTNGKIFKPRQFAFLPVQLFPVASCQGGVLSRRPVAERRHLGRVLCGLTCPLRYAPSESAAAGTTQRLNSGPPRATELYSPSLIFSPYQYPQRHKDHSHSNIRADHGFLPYRH